MHSYLFSPTPTSSTASRAPCPKSLCQHLSPLSHVLKLRSLTPVPPKTPHCLESIEFLRRIPPAYVISTAGLWFSLRTSDEFLQHLVPFAPSKLRRMLFVWSLRAARMPVDFNALIVAIFGNILLSSLASTTSCRYVVHELL